MELRTCEPRSEPLAEPNWLKVLNEPPVAYNADKGIEMTEHRLRKHLEEALEEARVQVMEETKS